MVRQSLQLSEMGMSLRSGNHESGGSGERFMDADDAVAVAVSEGMSVVAVTMRVVGVSEGPGVVAGTSEVYVGRFRLCAGFA